MRLRQVDINWGAITVFFVIVVCMDLIGLEIIRSIVDRRRVKRDGTGGTQDIATWGVLTDWALVIAALVSGALWLWNRWRPNLANETNKAPGSCEPEFDKSVCFSVDTLFFNRKFERIGARLKVMDRARQWHGTTAGLLMPDIGEYRKGEFTGMHRVVMNTENESRAVRDVAFMN